MLLCSVMPEKKNRRWKLSDKLKLWEAVEKTNPAHTKQVNFGRKITAIDPYQQVRNATEQFGPAGDGWGWSVQQTQFLPTNEVGVLVRLWHGSSDNYIEQWGQNGLYIDKAEQKKDTDCLKKATTDGLTKCLSFLGFNADIFLGKFDDSKYVQSLVNEQANLPITEEQGIELFAGLHDVGADQVKFFAYFKIKKMDELPASRFKQAKEMIDAKRVKSNADS